MRGIEEKLVYERKDGRWEARYKKGVSPEGKTLYGAVYGDSREEVIERDCRIFAYFISFLDDMVTGADFLGKCKERQ